jgi:ABC-type multidrug transport system ATPase subunit
MIGLDPHAIKELKSMITELKSSGATILVSTHMIESVDMLWDRALIMKSGRICANVTKEELDANGETLEEVFFKLTEQSPEQTADGGFTFETVMDEDDIL